MAELRDYPLLLLVVVVPVLILMTELGYRLGKRFQDDEKRHEQFVVTRDQVGVLLSLLLGFTLALATSRYDLRWQQAVEEADSVSTARLRAELLPEPMRADARRMFEEYIDARLEFASVGHDPAAMRRAHDKSTDVEARIWAQATAAAEKAPTPVTAAYVTSVNDAIDACDRRLAGLENRIPRTIWIMLAVLSVVSSLTAGLSMRRRSLAAMIPPLIFGVVTLLIADLDAPGKGLIHTDQRAIARLRQ
jgi:hypothetical protein